ncbi:MAG: D-glycero-beta-D-manno-heptose 1,7-bisphosphate 7-phosphatase [Methylococcaceae bacterium]
MTQNHYVLLDRDGVINADSDDYIKSPDEWQPISGSLEAIALLNQAGFKVAVLTNQSGLGRGLFDIDTLDAIHAKMRRLLRDKGGEIAGLYYCPHVPDDHCACRKPKPGLAQQFSQETGTSLENVFFVGDAFRDIQTALAVGAQPLLVKTGKGLKTIADHPELTLPIFDDLYAAAQYILHTGK